MSDPNLQKLSEIRKRLKALEDQKRLMTDPVRVFLSDPLVDRTKEPWYQEYRKRMTPLEDEMAVLREQENNVLLDILSNQSAQMTKALDASNQATERLIGSSRQLEKLTAMLIVLTLAMLLSSVVLIFIQEASAVPFPFNMIPLILALVAVVYIYQVIRKLRTSLPSIIG